MTATIRAYSLAVIAGIMVLATFGLAWSYVLSLRPVFEWHTPGELVPSHVRAGDTAMLCRDFTVLRPVSVTLTRSVVRRLCPECSERTAFNTTTVNRVPARYNRCRPIVIPLNLPTGPAELETAVQWVDWPFWSRSEPVPIIHFTVIE